MALLTTQNLEIFVTEFLKEDLKQLDLYINKYNEQIMEYVQLKNTLQTLHENSDGSFKTQMSSYLIYKDISHLCYNLGHLADIGGNIFMEAKVNNPDDSVLVDVGKGYFVQFTLAEAMKFSNFKVKILTKECDVLREESVKKRSDIKLALMCIADQENLYAEQK